jgi:hypothetical protein
MTVIQEDGSFISKPCLPSANMNSSSHAL